MNPVLSLLIIASYEIMKQNGYLAENSLSIFSVISYSRQRTSIITNFDYDTIKRIRVITIKDDIDEVPDNSKVEGKNQLNIPDYITDSDNKKMIKSKLP